MRIVIYFKQGIEPTPREVNLESLLFGENIQKAFKQLNITNDTFNSGFIELTDKETEVTMKFTYFNYKEFERVLWYLRQKLLKQKKL